MNLKPHVGTQFVHRRIVDMTGRHALCTVTKIDNAIIHYRVNGEGDAYTTLTRWPSIADPVKPQPAICH